jgi:chromosome segregation ATPase
MTAMARALLTPIVEEMRAMQARLDEFREVLQEVKGNSSALKQAVEALATKIDEAADDPEEVRALVEELRTVNTELEETRGRAKKSK